MSRPPHTILKEIGFTLLSEGKTLKVKAEGFSMYPAIKPGSVIYIESFGEGNWPVPGEIIAWKNESGLVVHRFVRVLKEGEDLFFVTRGDSRPFEDDPVGFEQLAGRIVKVEYPEGKERDIKGINFRKPDYTFNRLNVLVRLHLNKVKRLFLD